MKSRARLGQRTIDDFGEQWARFPGNEGWYGSVDLLADIVEPLLRLDQFRGRTIVEIGSGAGRIVQMMLDAGAAHVYAVEPSAPACEVLRSNLDTALRRGAVTVLPVPGDAWSIERTPDLVVSIGVLHHIPDPEPVMRRAYEALPPGGIMFAWLYGSEGHRAFLVATGLLRVVATRLPHQALEALTWILYGALVPYAYVSRFVPLPLRGYLHSVLWPMTPEKRRLVIYDQLNPAYAKYYTREEAIGLFERAGFTGIAAHHRHGYSWSVLGRKPDGPASADAPRRADDERAAVR